MSGFIQAYVNAYHSLWPTTRRLLIETYNAPVQETFDNFVHDLQTRFLWSWEDTAVLAALVLALSLYRFLLDRCFSRPLAKVLKLTDENRPKLPESVFKLTFYFSMWCISAWMLNGKVHAYFSNPDAPFVGWTAGMPVSRDVFWFYMTQMAFYIHSIYGTMYWDERRRDTGMMMVHHFVTTTLLMFSFGVRLHKIGLMILFLHDVSDWCLEVTKICNYLKTRSDGNVYKFYDVIAGVGFVAFAGTWGVFRLYWFPTLVLSTLGEVLWRNLESPPFPLLFQVLLIGLQIMSIVWYKYIIEFIIRVVIFGEEMRDERDFEDEQAAQLQKKTKAVTQSQPDTPRRSTRLTKKDM